MSDKIREMDFLKALIVLGPHANHELIKKAFDAPGWSVQFCVPQELEDISKTITCPFDMFDWLLIADDVPLREFFTLEHLATHHTLKDNMGLLRIVSLTHTSHTELNDPSDCAVSMEGALWQQIAQCIYSAHFAPESMPANAVDIFKYYQLKGQLRLQTPLFARIASLILSNISVDPERVNLGLWEMLINGIEHGNLGVSHEEKRLHVENHDMDELIQKRLQQESNRQKHVTVDFSIESKIANFEIKDDGEGFDWQKFWDIDHMRLLNKSGRGIALARMAGFDVINYLGKGNHVKCTVLFG